MNEEVKTRIKIAFFFQFIIWMMTLLLFGAMVVKVVPAILDWFFGALLYFDVFLMIIYPLIGLLLFIFMVRGPKKKIFYSISFLAVIWIIDCLILVLAGHIDRKFFGG